MPQDIGGGQRGEGGKLADAADTTPSDPTDNRTILDYNPVNSRARLEARFAKEAAFALAQEKIQQYIVRLVSDDALLASPVYQGITSDQKITIVKPYDLQKTPFHNQTIGDYTWVYSSATARTRTNNVTGEVIEQTIQEPYIVDTDVIWVAEDPLTGDLIDLNISGKHWSGPAGGEINRYLLITQGGDFLTCQLLDSEGAVTGDPDIIIAKPPLLRRTPFDGQTYNGISYAYTGNSARTATKTPDTQDEIVIPPYLDGISIIHAIEVANNTGVEEPVDTDITLIDLNVDARLWARK